MLTPFSADNPAENVQSFVKKYQEAYGATPDQFAADAYDAIYVIKAAVEKADSTSGAALASALTSLTVEGVTGIMTWTAMATPISPPALSSTTMVSAPCSILRINSLSYLHSSFFFLISISSKRLPPGRSPVRRSKPTY